MQIHRARTEHKRQNTSSKKVKFSRLAKNSKEQRSYTETKAKRGLGEPSSPLNSALLEIDNEDGTKQTYEIFDTNDVKFAAIEYSKAKQLNKKQVKKCQKIFLRKLRELDFGAGKASARGPGSENGAGGIARSHTNDVTGSETFRSNFFLKKRKRAEKEDKQGLLESQVLLVTPQKAKNAKFRSKSTTKQRTPNTGYMIYQGPFQASISQKRIKKEQYTTNKPSKIIKKSSKKNTQKKSNRGQVIFERLWFNATEGKKLKDKQSNQIWAMLYPFEPNKGKPRENTTEKQREHYFRNLSRKKIRNFRERSDYTNRNPYDFESKLKSSKTGRSCSSSRGGFKKSELSLDKRSTYLDIDYRKVIGNEKKNMAKVIKRYIKRRDLDRKGRKSSKSSRTGGRVGKSGRESWKKSRQDSTVWTAAKKRIETELLKTTTKKSSIGSTRELTSGEMGLSGGASGRREWYFERILREASQVLEHQGPVMVEEAAKAQLVDFLRTPEREQLEEKLKAYEEDQQLRNRLGGGARQVITEESSYMLEESKNGSEGEALQTESLLNSRRHEGYFKINLDARVGSRQKKCPRNRRYERLFAG